MNPAVNEHQKRMLDLIEEQLNGTLTPGIKNEANFICAYGFLGLPLVLIP
jgi:hypothetical protein